MNQKYPFLFCTLDDIGMISDETIDTDSKRPDSAFGLKYYFVAPFLPRRTLTSFCNQDSAAGIFWLVLLTHLLLINGLGYLIGQGPQINYARLDLQFFIFGFLFGVFGRVFLLAYIFWIVSKRIFKRTIPFSVCVNIVLITLLPLSSGIIIDFIVYPNYGFSYYSGLIYSWVLMAIALKIYVDADFSKALALIISAHFILWLMAATFAGIPL